MMFLRSVGAVVRGVSAFPEFAKRNPFRALFHLLLFCVILSFLCSGITLGFVGKRVDICTRGLQDRFGKILISEAGILPEKNAEEPWYFYFPGNVRLDYISGEGQFSAKELDEWKQNVGIFWAKRGFFVWMRPDPSRGFYYLMPLVNLPETVKFLPAGSEFFKPVGKNAVESELNRYLTKPEIRELTDTSVDFAAIGKSVKKYLYVILSISAVLGNFVLTLILILMCAGLQALWKAQGLETLKFGGTVSLLCYASFPALTVRMLLESFSFPGIGEILFFIVFFIYQMIAFQEVRRSLAGGRDGTDI